MRNQAREGRFRKMSLPQAMLNILRVYGLYAGLCRDGRSL
jgi:hypothetical protein